MTWSPVWHLPPNVGFFWSPSVRSASRHFAETTTTSKALGGIELSDYHRETTVHSGPSPIDAVTD